ncbi:hypothetical protein N7495_005863 [Penicillium taxi]|uniref:uncharacterized protein n=1 Tax=Penicillium taxi TaxID=168475 RepID=UPI0025450D26|nr:uncharacterized protein N7495_005863 [Penicillium taxi]KAJ5894172.1 hypothetical protein N7495_005863 [Penicillium taxi]
MVSTRHHPCDFPTSSRATTKLDKPPTTTETSQKWVHTPSTTLTIWLVISVPVVLWDAGYVMLRPHSMPGGQFHSPIWTPYALYGKIDFIYGWPAFNANNGFTAAQTALNLVETAGYAYYLWIVYIHGETGNSSRGAHKPKKGILWLLTDEKVVVGHIGAVALLISYTASAMTLCKTLLYWLNEYFSNFGNIGHNPPITLICCWIIPNGLWIIFPAYNLYILGTEILNSLEQGSPRNVPISLKSE